jgi:medium-chain acyl-[acyl-carrier-protein] hydrolase
MSLLVPILRADFQLIETSSLPSIQPVAAPISAAVGDNDCEVGRGDMEPWQDYTRSEFLLRSYPGNHFFPWTCSDQVIGDMEKSLKFEV